MPRRVLKDGDARYIPEKDIESGIWDELKRIAVALESISKILPGILNTAQVSIPTGVNFATTGGEDGEVPSTEDKE